MMMRAALQRLFDRPLAVLPEYRSPRSPMRQAALYGTLYVICIFSGLFYGSATALLPPGLLLYVLMPIGLLVLLIIWALPDFGRPPTRWLARFLFALTFCLCAWPNYIALGAPGLPWLSFERISSSGLALTLLLCLTAAVFRKDLSRSYWNARPIWTMVIAFQAIQVVVLLWARQPLASLTIVGENSFLWTAAFAASAWLFLEPERERAWVRFFLAMGLLQCAIGVGEFFNSGLLWAGYIPPFLQVDQQYIDSIVQGLFRDGQYRVTSSFSVSLSFAEYLSCVVPFVLHRILNNKQGIFSILIWVSFDLLLLGVIVVTRSRLGIVGWLGAHFFYIMIWSFKRWKTLKADVLAPALSLVYPVGAAIFVFMMFTVPAVRNRTIGGGSTSLSDDARREQFAMLWPRLANNPFGYGAGQSGVVLQYRVPGGLLTVDSYIITLSIDYGVLGLFLFYGLVLWAAWAATKVYWESPEDSRSQALPIGTTILVVGVTKLVLSQEDNIPLLFILIGAAASIYARFSLAGRDPSASAVVHRARRPRPAAHATW